MKALEHTTFPDVAERISALYNEDEDALLLGMLGQEYVIRHQGIFLRGQKAPDAHGAVVLDYLFSSGDQFRMTPWKSFGDLAGRPAPEFRTRVEVPLQQQVSNIIGRAATILPHLDAKADQSLIQVSGLIPQDAVQEALTWLSGWPVRQVRSWRCQLALLLQSGG